MANKILNNKYFMLFNQRLACQKLKSKVFLQIFLQKLQQA